MTARSRGFALLGVALMSVHPGLPADLSPANWAPAEKARAEAEQGFVSPANSRAVEGANGLVAATTSPIAVQAGIEALRQGGTAADAAATVALTQITTALGSYVSAAGVLQLVYYDAASGKVVSLNAGWNSWIGETNPGTIPPNPPGFAEDPAASREAIGRRTLVPGFMAGIEAMHKRFGRLPFADVFQPATWYAENGVTVTALHAAYFRLREKALSRTEEGRQFLHQADGHAPRVGDRFVQTELAKTLRGVARDGAAYMYTGPWGQRYVDAVNRESGKASMEDMRRYRPTWEEPLHSTFGGYDIFAPGASTDGGFAVLEAMNLAEERKTQAMGPYWKDWRAFRDLTSILQFAQNGAFMEPQLNAFTQRRGIVLNPAERATKPWARAVAPFIDEMSGESPRETGHSDSIVVIDRWGNVAALVHSINSVVWGTTGIVVEGVPISDAAGINQFRLARMKPGGRVRDDMGPVIVMNQAKPALAVASIGASLTFETARLLVGILGNGQDAATVMAAPPLLNNYQPLKPGETPARRARLIPAGAYDAGFIADLGAAGVRVRVMNATEVNGLRGTAVLGSVEGKMRRGVETSGVAGFATAY